MFIRQLARQRVIAAVLLVLALGALVYVNPARLGRGSHSGQVNLTRSSFGLQVVPGSDSKEGKMVSDARSFAPEYFIENQGQMDPSIQFYTQAPGIAVFFRPDAVVYSLIAGRERPDDASRQQARPMGSAILVRFVGADEVPIVRGERELGGKINSYRGSDRSKWHSGLRTYGEVTYSSVYDGVDLGFLRKPYGIKSEWIVGVGGDPGDIRLRYEGAEAVLLESGGLEVRTPAGNLREEKPLIYQDKRSGRLRIDGGFKVYPNGDVGFWIGEYDESCALVIDPALEWSTFLGGGGIDNAYGVAVDDLGNVYVTGETGSPDFPTTPGAFDVSFNGGFIGDAFVTKFGASGGNLVFSTFLGSAGADLAQAIAVDSATNVYVGGGAGAEDFPITPGVLDSLWENGDGFIVKLDPSGTLIYSTFLGGLLSDGVSFVEPSDSQEVWVAGVTSSPDFPTTSGAYQASPPAGDADVYVAKLTAAGDALLYSTLLGGSDRERFAGGVAIDETGVFLAGATTSSDFPTTQGAYDRSFNGRDDGFVAKLDLSLSTLQFSTFLGGTGDDGCADIDVRSGDAFVIGSTTSSDFPTTPGAFDRSVRSWDAFVTRLDSSGSALVYSTFLGGKPAEAGYAIVVDATENAVVTGASDDAGGQPYYPTTPGAFQTKHARPGYDVFVSKLNPMGSDLLYSTYLGGGRGWGSDYGWAIALDGQNNIYVAGVAGSTDFPTTPGAFDTTHNDGVTHDGFVTKLRLGPILTFNGIPSAENPVNFTVSSAPSVETGAFAQVVLSCSGTSGIPLPGGETLPLTFDGCTSLSLVFGPLLRGTIDAAGTAATPTIPFPSVPAGRTVHGAAFTYFPGGLPMSVTPPIQIVTQ